MSGQGGIRSGLFQRGKSGALFGSLLVLLALVSIVMVVGAPGQVTVAGIDTTTAGPEPQVQIALSLKNGGLVDVRTDPVVQAVFVLVNGSTVERSFYHASLTVPAGGTTRLKWTVSLPNDPLMDFNLTAFLRVRGPISEAFQVYELP